MLCSVTGLTFEQQVADEAAAHAHDDADDRDAEQVEAALTAESGGEQRALDAAEPDGGQVGPQRDHEERLIHASIVGGAVVRIARAHRRCAPPSRRGRRRP